MHIDHPSRTASEEQPGRTIKGESPLAGVFTEAGHYETNGWDGPGIYAKARIMPQFIEDIKAMDGHIGISHYVSGMSEMGEADGKKGPIIKELIAHPTNTVDFVTVPGAGGRYRAMFSEIATRNTEIKKKGANMPEKLTLKEIKANHSGLILELKEELIKEIQNADDGKAVLKEIADAKTKRRMQTSKRNLQRARQRSLYQRNYLKLNCQMHLKRSLKSLCSCRSRTTRMALLMQSNLKRRYQKQLKQRQPRLKQS